MLGYGCKQPIPFVPLVFLIQYNLRLNGVRLHDQRCAWSFTPMQVMYPLLETKLTSRRFQQIHFFGLSDL